MQRSAELSHCGLYRYSLTRVWEETLPQACWIMLNPSTADATTDDATIRRCVGFARRWGYGGILVVNLFAYRATYPSDLWRAAEGGVDIVGPANDGAIGRATARGEVVAAWGSTPKQAQPRVECVLAALRDRCEVLCLGTTADGSPKHPIRLPARLMPTPFVLV